MKQFLSQKTSVAGGVFHSSRSSRRQKRRRYIQKLWKATPKLKFSVHFREWQSVSLGNPRFFRCYSHEDMVSHLVDVEESFHPSTMSTTAVFKWLTLVFAKNLED